MRKGQNILAAHGPEVASRFTDQQYDFEGKSQGMVMTRIFGVTSQLFGHFLIDFGYL